MFTPARIFAAIGLTCAGTLTSYGDVMPTWVRIVVGAVNLFSGAIVAISGPVQTAKSDKP